MLLFLKAFLLTGVPILLLVSGVEHFSIAKRNRSENTRKFIHIIVGTYAAFWPLFLSWTNIELLGLGALLALLVSRTFNVFKSMHFVRKYATGEYLAAISVTLVALISHNAWLFAIAMLNLSLADGFAAVVGIRFGKSNTYKIFGSTKSIVGSATFFLVSVFLVSSYIAFGPGHLAWPTLVWLPLLATVVENVSIAGTDNLFVPLLVVCVMRWL